MIRDWGDMTAVFSVGTSSQFFYGKLALINKDGTRIVDVPVNQPVEIPKSFTIFLDKAKKVGFSKPVQKNFCAFFGYNQHRRGLVNGLYEGTAYSIMNH